MRFRIPWEKYDTVNDARVSLWNAVREGRWDLFGLEEGPTDDRVLTVETEDALLVYMDGDWAMEGEAL